MTCETSSGGSTRRTRHATRVWRQHRDLSVKALAEKAGIAPAYLSQIETGKRDGTLSTIKKIADALDVTVDDLVG